MPLLDLKTELKDLKFGTLAPYVQKDINNPGIPSSNQIQARVDDLERLTKMLIDKPGVEFAAKQVALEASKIDSVRDLFQINTLINPALRIGNILLQVPVNRTGTHFSALGGGALNNFYTRNSNATGEALSGREVRVERNSKLQGKVSRLREGRLKTEDVTNKYTATSAFAKSTLSDSEFTDRTQAALEASTAKSVVLSQKPDLVDTRTSDAINLLDVGSKSESEDLLGVTFNVLDKPAETLLTFRGFVQNISDNFTGNWQGVNYVGRMEQFFTYTGFTRTFSFQLVIPMFSPAEQPITYNKINSLVSYTAPTYVNNLPQGTIVFMALGNYLRTPGIINSVSTTVANDVPWSKSLPGQYGGDSENGPVRILPQVITANIQFTPIHNKVPQLHTAPFSTETPDGPFINRGNYTVGKIPEVTTPGVTNGQFLVN